MDQNAPWNQRKGHRVKQAEKLPAEDDLPALTKSSRTKNQIDAIPGQRSKSPAVESRQTAAVMPVSDSTLTMAEHESRQSSRIGQSSLTQRASPQRAEKENKDLASRPKPLPPWIKRSKGANAGHPLEQPKVATPTTQSGTTANNLSSASAPARTPKVLFQSSASARKGVIFDSRANTKSPVNRNKPIKPPAAFSAFSAARPAEKTSEKTPGPATSKTPGPSKDKDKESTTNHSLKGDKKSVHVPMDHKSGEKTPTVLRSSHKDPPSRTHNSGRPSTPNGLRANGSKLPNSARTAQQSQKQTLRDETGKGHGEKERDRDDRKESRKHEELSSRHQHNNRVHSHVSQRSQDRPKVDRIEGSPKPVMKPAAT